MNRAMRRRQKRQDNKATKTLNMSVSALEQVKSRATNDAVAEASAIMLGIPLKVGFEQYGWTKDQCEMFGNDIVTEYTSFADGDVTLAEYKALIEELTGMRFEKEERR